MGDKSCQQENVWWIILEKYGISNVSVIHTLMKGEESNYDVREGHMLCRHSVQEPNNLQIL